MHRCWCGVFSGIVVALGGWWKAKEVLLCSVEVLCCDGATVLCVGILEGMGAAFGLLCMGGSGGIARGIRRRGGMLWVPSHRR